MPRRAVRCTAEDKLPTLTGPHSLQCRQHHDDGHDDDGGGGGGDGGGGDGDGGDGGGGGGGDNDDDTDVMMVVVMFLKLVARGFLRVLRFPPLLHRFNGSANKIKIK